MQNKDTFNIHTKFAETSTKCNLNSNFSKWNGEYENFTNFEYDPKFSQAKIKSIHHTDHVLLVRDETYNFQIFASNVNPFHCVRLKFNMLDADDDESQNTQVSTDLQDKQKKNQSDMLNHRLYWKCFCKTSHFENKLYARIFHSNLFHFMVCMFCVIWVWL